MTSVFVDRSRDGDDAAARQIAGMVLPYREKFISELFAATVADVPDLAVTAHDRTLLYASIAENTAVLIATLSDGSDPSVLQPPPGAGAYARELARRGVSLSVLLRAYRIGQAKFTGMCLDVANGGNDVDDYAALRTVVSKVAAFIDRICEVVTVDYEMERERWITQRSGLTHHWIARIMSGALSDAATAQAALNYPLTAVHIAMEVWVAETANPVSALGATQQLIRTHVPCRQLLCAPLDTDALSIWIAQAPAADHTLMRLRAALATAKLPICVAVGMPGAQLAGFRSSHSQALRVKELMRSASPPAPSFLTFRDVAPVAMLTGNRDEERAFVAQILGPLAENNARAMELRETLRNYIACNLSPTATAARMVMHRNTIRYRVHLATEELGINLEESELFALSTALEICRWRGASALTPRCTTAHANGESAQPFRLARRQTGGLDSDR